MSNKTSTELQIEINDKQDEINDNLVAVISELDKRMDIISERCDEYHKRILELESK